MKNTLNGFPIDGTSVTQIKYDIFAQHMTKAMGVSTAISTTTYGDALMGFGVVLSLVLGCIGLVLSLIIGIIWVIGWVIKSILIKIFG